MLATPVTVLILYMWTGELLISTEVGIILNSVKTILYYAHERVWNKLTQEATPKEVLQ